MPCTEDDSFRLAIVMGLRNGLRLCHGMRRQLTEEEQHKVARAIAEQIRVSNYRIDKGPPAPPHGGGYDLRPVSDREG